MNIYFMHNEENEGLYVIAVTRQSAKKIYSHNSNNINSFMDIRGHKVISNVPEKYEGVIDLDNPKLRKYDLHYYDEEGKEIPYIDCTNKSWDKI